MHIIIMFNVFFWLITWQGIETAVGDRILTPYVHQHGSRLSHRAIRDCQPGGKEPHETYPAHTSKNLTLPFVEVKRFLKVLSPDVNKNVVRGHYAIVSNPLRTISVLEPNEKYGCSHNLRQTVLETAKKRNCEVAINAGYFDTKNGNCLGNVISDGRLAHNSGGIQNAHFGLMKNNTIYTGYVSKTQVLEENFLQLVGGVVWIVRDGNDYVNISQAFECEGTEETGPMEMFLSTLSSRTAIGYDRDGKIVIVQVDGKTHHYGIPLWDMQKILHEMGVISAINLDGGGSSTFVVNGTVVNYPSDECSQDGFICERKVSTIICVHAPDCEPPDCSGHGECKMGLCICDKYWLPPYCDKLSCKNDCSFKGNCTKQGCDCNAGFYGEDCDTSCPSGWFGIQCKNRCTCMNGGVCGQEGKSCLCPPGFFGDKCQHACPFGRYGHNCESLCECGDSCFCDPANGSCSAETKSNTYMMGKCIAETMLQQKHSEKDHDEQTKKYEYFVIMFAVATAVSTAVLALFLIYACTCHCKTSPRLCKKRKERYVDLQNLTELSDSDESVPMNVLNGQ